MVLLQNRVDWDSVKRSEIRFDSPSVEELVNLGYERDDVARLLGAGWWAEMVDEIVETPDFSEPGESREVVLGYARDVISEYIRKRFQP